MKKILVMLAVVLVLCGCATFGTFTNLEKGETTKAEVRSMLGEPANRRTEDGMEVWEYHFVRGDAEKVIRPRTVMNLSITFKDDVVEDYEVTISRQGEQQGVPRGKAAFPPARKLPRRRRPNL